MKFVLSAQNPIALKTPCLIVGVFEGSRLSGPAAAVNKASKGRLSRLIKNGDVSTKLGTCCLWPEVPGVAAERILLVGCGQAARFGSAQYHQANTAAGRFLRDKPFKAAATTLPAINTLSGDEGWKTRQAALATAAGNYRYTATRKPPKFAGLSKLVFFGSRSQQRFLAQATAISAGVLRARELGNLPPNICTPTYLAEQARAIAARFEKARIQVLGRKRMEKLGMGALLGVGLGSATPPKLIVLRYLGAPDSKAKPHVLVGKGITFDTGGISLKPGKGMDEMKYDMCGAAGVLGAFEACAMLDLPINFIAVVPAVENMPDGKSYRPGDVLSSLSGQTIEVLNTDAEGRLILCDALTYVERFNPATVIDAATLTGACVIALGKHASGLMTNDDRLADDILAAGEKVHDRAWRLPIWDDYQSQLDTPYADMANVGGRTAGAITAGCFLARFTDKYRWAHLDVAGTAWDGGTKNGASGRPAGILAQYLIDRAS
ncbi:MAG: leucyl aminopeptidase [Xanthomonadales bacterium]|nr:leucyl aminopeptidase [Xanthomonadales bacterium]